MQGPLIVSARQYAKSWALQSRWQLKQKQGDYAGHYTSLREVFAPRSTDSTDDADAEKLRRIAAKVQAGRKLSTEEMEFLRKHNPVLYEKLKNIEREQKEYEEELKRCETKDEAARLHMAQSARTMELAKDGDETALYRMNRMNETHQAFTDSEEYKRLPTEAEEAAERDAVSDAEREEQAARLAEAREAREAASGDGEAEPVESADAEAAGNADTEAVRQEDGGVEAQTSESAEAAESQKPGPSRRAEQAAKPEPSRRAETAPKQHTREAAKAVPAGSRDAEAVRRVRDMAKADAEASRKRRRVSVRA